MRGFESERNAIAQYMRAQYTQSVEYIRLDLRMRASLMKRKHGAIADKPTALGL